jgi:hypothetical protein
MVAPMLLLPALSGVAFRGGRTPAPAIEEAA